MKFKVENSNLNLNTDYSALKNIMTKQVIYKLATVKNECYIMISDL